jgi:hypothetical protein
VPKSKSADSATASTTTITGPGTGSLRIRTAWRRRNIAAPSASEGQWIKSALSTISKSGPINPSDSIFKPVRRPIWPMMIESEIPARKPVRIGRDRRVASIPSRSARAMKQNTPTASASSAATATRSAVTPGVA